MVVANLTAAARAARVPIVETIELLGHQVVAVVDGAVVSLT